MARWDGPPFAGEVWQTKRVLGRKVRTRHVMDRTLGADVVYVEGRWSRFARQSQCTLGEWTDWIKNAKLIRTDEMGAK